MLQVFWGKTQADKWSALFRDPDVAESPKNLISLNHHIHHWFDYPKLALKPLRTLSNGSIVVQFHWLKQHSLKPSFVAGSFEEFMAKAGLSDNQSWGKEWFFTKGGNDLETGQTFVLGAEDPENAPSFLLLELSWNILRLAAISGAANLSDDNMDLDDFDEENSESLNLSDY